MSARKALDCHAAAGKPSDAAQRSAHDAKYDLVVMAASAGGLHALEQILGTLPADFPAPIAIVQHRTAKLPLLLAQILGRHTHLKVKNAEAGERLLPGTVYLAPPALHLHIQPHGFCDLSDGMRIRHVYSSANPLFTSAADAFGSRVIAVVLTGGDRDATDGVQSIKEKGGVVIAQDQATSQIFGMPHSAIETGCVDHVLPIQDIGPALLQLVKTGSL
jgi:two-component system chemotaxis response regulator CheB